MVDLVVDASASMTFLPEKAKRVAELVSFLINSSLVAGASVQAYAIGGQLEKNIFKVPIKPVPSVSSEAPFRDQIARIPFRPATFRVLVSDLLLPDDPAPIFHQLTQRQGIPIIFSPYSLDEANPDWSGNYDFIDAETENLAPHRVEASTLRHYLSAYQNHFKVWKDISTRYRAPLARIPTEMELMQALQKHALATKSVEMI